MFYYYNYIYKLVKEKGVAMEQYDHHVKDAAAQDDRAIILGCAGGKGGQGASMLSISLAGLLSSEMKTVLVDLDLNSTHRHLLGRDECTGVSNLATVIGEISSLSLENIVQHHPSGFDILPGLRMPEEERLLGQINLNLIFKLLTETYSLVVLDISSNQRLISMGALLQCSLVFLVIQPDLLSLRSAMRLVEFSGRCEGNSISWGLVINRSGPGDLIQPFQVSDVLNIPLLAVLPVDPAAGEDFSNFLDPGLGEGPYLSALEQMVIRLGLKERSTSTSNRGIPSRCLHALRGWTKGQLTARGEKGISCAI